MPETSPNSDVPRCLWLVRHAEAAATSTLGDHGRPLTGHGEAQAVRVGHWLDAQSIRPDWIVSSDALRAEATADSIRAAIGEGDVTHVREPSAYEGSANELLDVVRGTPPNQRAVVIVAHNPGISALAELLAGRPMAGLPTAGVATFEVLDDWPYLGAGSARLVHIVSASDLPPGPNTTGVAPWSS
jgi:phosphohistidine phosphatase